MISEVSGLETFDERVRRLAEADSASAVFHALLEASRTVVPRAAVFLVRQGTLQGWGSVGHAPDARRGLRQHVVRLGDGWLGELVLRPEAPLELRHAPHTGPGFGQPPADEAAAVVVRVKGKPIAALLAERHAGEAPWAPHALGVLATTARLKLELDLAARKLAAAREAEVPAREPARPAAPPPEAGAGASRGGDAAPVQAGLDPAGEPAVATEVAAVPEPVAEARPELDAARRYARLVATDIRLYNEDAVAQGRKHRDLTDRLGDELGRGKETFLRRHGELGPTGLEILREAYVEVLAAGDAELIPTATLR